MKTRTRKGSSPAARQTALGARPVRLPPVRTEEKDAKLYVTVRFQRPGWQRILGADVNCERTFGLDAYGRRVYDACNGERSVGTIIRNFAESTQVSLAEAEMAVTKFLKTLLTKGLVAMEMDRNG